MNNSSNALLLPVANRSRKRSSVDIPVWEKYALSVPEAAQYFSIGENKLRKYINEHQNDKYVLWNGSHALIKRKQFAEHLDNCNVI